MTTRTTGIFIILLFALHNKGLGQPPERQPDGGGNYPLANTKDDMTPQQRLAVVQMLKSNEQQLRIEGKLTQLGNPTATLFSWPLKQAPGFNDGGYYGISNYVDENPTYPNLLLDYNCGNRTYDLSSGYNHAGTDIFTWPFSWQKMARNAVQVIAGAPGTIIGKIDGNFDQNCAFCTGPCSWNAVYVMQADGSVAWYGHLKSGSLTTKIIGDNVITGEYLGVVGSSGNSTGPHLHFEVYTNSTYTQLVDPWAGPCNNMNGLTSWWADQQPYYMPTLNKVMTHSAAPAVGNCPASESPNEKINFANSEQVFVGSYLRDQQSGQQSVHTVYRPNGTVYNTWVQTYNTYFSASYWYYNIILPAAAMPGTWRYEVVFNGTQKQFAEFAVNSADVLICPGSTNTLISNITGSAYQWQVNTGSGFANINDNANYAGTLTRQLQLKDLPSSFYGYQYRCLVNGVTLSNVIGVKFVSYWKGYSSSAWENPSNWACGNIPDANTDVVVQAGATFSPEVNSNALCRSTTVSPGATITVRTGYNLTITR